MKEETKVKKIERLLKKSRHLDVKEICVMPSVLELKMISYTEKIKARANLKVDLISLPSLLAAFLTTNHGFWIFTSEQIRGALAIAILIFCLNLFTNLARYIQNRTPADPKSFIKSLLRGHK
ncbi:MAG: hypothetical protein HY396_01210 [Candidatus Doudnabacteria bacterium]|nr:hypothetical protein [Candidatus Doudnabacteria bacterium]